MCHFGDAKGGEIAAGRHSFGCRVEGFFDCGYLRRLIFISEHIVYFGSGIITWLKNHVLLLEGSMIVAYFLTHYVKVGTVGVPGDAPNY